MSTREGVEVRAMRPEDVPAIVELLDASLGPGPSGVDRGELFAWKHLRNPFGRSLALVAERESRLVGLRAFMRWTFATGDAASEIRAVRAVDTAIAPQVRRTGLFTDLTERAIADAAADGVAVVFNTPNEQSRPGYLKMGWRDVATWPMWIGMRRPTKVLRAVLRRDLASGPALEIPERTPLRSVTSVLARDDVVALVQRAVPGSQATLWTPRTQAYLRWRYADGPIGYHALIGPGSEPTVLVLGRVRARGPLREAVVTEVLFEPGAERAAAQMLWAFPGAAGADHGVASFGEGHPARALLGQAGMRRIPRMGLRMTARPLSPGPVTGPDPLAPSSWALSLGDLEVF